jgi:putative nucleotidyltransferase with HDIG domain
MGNHKEGSNPVVFPNFGVAKFTLDGVNHNGIDLSGMDIEAVMPRAEEYEAGSRKPSVQQATMKADAERRDLTINSLFKNVSTGEVLDLTGKGMDDLKRGVLRTPLDPDQTFQDDPLRMLRVVRFFAKYGYKVPKSLLTALKKNASRLDNISNERITDELNKMLVTQKPQDAMRMLQITGLLDYVIPELQSAVGMEQNVHHSRDVWGHTLDVLKNTKPDLVNRLMGLFHDIGKTTTKSVTPTGIHFYGHEKDGADIARKVLTRLKYPNEIIDAVVQGVRNHMRMKQAGDTGAEISDKALRKFKHQMGDNLEHILDLMQADNVSHADASSMPNQVANIRKRLDKLDMDITAGRPKLPISGKDLMAVGMKPGPVFSEIISAVTEAWYENPKLSKEEAMQIARSIYEKEK